MKKICAFLGFLPIIFSLSAAANQLSPEVLTMDCILRTANSENPTQQALRLQKVNSCFAGQITEKIPQWTFGEAPQKSTEPATFRVNICEDGAILSVIYKNQVRIETLTLDNQGYEIEFGEIETGRDFDIARFTCTNLHPLIN